MADANTFLPVTGQGAHAAQHLVGGADPLSMAILFPTPVTLSDGATISTDASLGTHFRVTLGGNRTLANPTGATNGQRITWEIIQDGTGSRTLSYGSKFAFGTDVTSPVLSTTAAKRDFIGAIYNASTDKFYVVAFSRGF
jgi:hypothetical protein